MTEQLTISKNVDQLWDKIIKRADGYNQRYQEMADMVNSRLDGWLGEIHRRRFLHLLFGEEDAALLDRPILRAIKDWADEGEDAVREAYCIVLEDINNRLLHDELAPEDEHVG